MIWSQNGIPLSTEKDKDNWELHGFAVLTKVEAGQQFSTLIKDKITANDTAKYGCEPVGRPKSEAYNTDVFVRTSK